MDFSLTREQEMLKKLAAEFAEKELEPAAAEMDREHKFNEENFAKMAKLGFTGLGIPREYGGSGGGATEKVIVVSEFAKKVPDLCGDTLHSQHHSGGDFKARHGGAKKEIPSDADGGRASGGIRPDGAGGRIGCGRREDDGSL